MSVIFLFKKKGGGGEKKKKKEKIITGEYLGGNILSLVGTSWLAPANPQHITDLSSAHTTSVLGQKN